MAAAWPARDDADPFTHRMNTITKYVVTNNLTEADLTWANTTRIPGATTKDKENRRVPFNPEGRLAAVLKRRAALGPDAFVFGAETGSYQPNIQTAWETLKLRAYGHEPKPSRKGAGLEPRATSAHRPALARPAPRGRLSAVG